MTSIDCDRCIICQEDESDYKLNVVSSKGRNTMLECTKLRNDLTLFDYISSESSKVLAHTDCYRRYTDKRACWKEVEKWNGTLQQ